MTATVVLSGACACEAVRWQSTTHPSHLDFCYCLQCQRITGAAFGAWLGIAKEGLTFEGGRTYHRLSDIATRSFCTRCGGTLTIQYDCYPGKTHIAAGTVVQGGKAVPRVGCHLFTGRKPSWYSIPEDGVTRWDEFDDEFLEVLRSWSKQQ